MSRRLYAVLVCAVAAFSITLAGACGGGGEAEEGDSCESSSECSGELQCLNGKCSKQQNANNGADGGTDAGDAGDNNGVVEEEDYFVSYILHDKADDSKTLHVYSTADDTHTQVSPEDISCAERCWLSRDMSHFLWAERSAQGSGAWNIHRASVEDLEVQDDRELLLEEVSGVSVVDNTVTFRRDNNGQYVAYYLPLDGGGEQSLGSLGSSQSTLNGWHISPEAGVGMIFSPEPQLLRLKIGQLGQSISDTSYTLSAENYQEISGGYFGSSMPVAVSPDGKRLAFVTEAPNNYEACDTAADCTGPVKRCGRFGFCTAIEVTAHFVDLENLGRLGQGCGGPGTCDGDIHECYSPSQDENDHADAVCIPGRVVVGLPFQPQQQADPQSPQQNGCDLSSGQEGYHYTKLRGPITFDEGGNLYVAAARDCTTNNNPVGDSDVLKIDPVAGTYETAWGNPNDAGGYDGGLCWDAEANDGEGAPDGEQCVPYIRSALLSPSGNELAVQATNPWVGDPSRALDNMGLWTVLKNGEEQSWAGGQGLREEIGHLSVHPAN